MLDRFQVLMPGRQDRRGRIDVENPKPNQRKEQIHYQNGNDKYLYNPKENTFTDAPRSVNDLLKNKDVRKAIDKGLKYLGDDNFYITFFNLLQQKALRSAYQEPSVCV